ncbi:MAG: radical SAM protein [Spirochaetaceae bacterium]
MAVIIFKAIEYCNSNCIYCSVIEKDEGHTMSYERLETVFIRMNQYLEELPDEIIDFTWHGGEATLLGPEYFRKALEFQNVHCKKTKNRIKHIIQSNLTCITQEIIDVLKDLGINSIGSSYDPIEGIRGIGKNRDSKLYKELFFKGVDLVEKNGMTWGIIYVVHRRSLEDPVGIFNHLSNLNLGTSPVFNCIYLYEDDKHHLSITPEEFADFLGALVPLYMENPEKYKSIRPLSMFIDSIKEKTPLGCDYAGNCANYWLYIGPTGELSHCGRAGDQRIISYGNIDDTSLKEALNHPYRKKILARQTYLVDNDCKGCKYWGICHGGCPVDALSMTGDIMNKAMSCEMVKRLMSKYIEPLVDKEVQFYPNN